MELTKEEKIMQSVLSEAWNNPSFKEELKANPTDAIQRLTGESFSLPEGKTLVVCDQSNLENVYLNIPQQPNFANVELTDHQLEEVAGGCIPAIYIKKLPYPWYPPICTYPGNTGTPPIIENPAPQ